MPDPSPAWRLVRALAARTGTLRREGVSRAYAVRPDGGVAECAAGPQAALTWEAATGWQSGPSVPDDVRELVDLYRPLLNASIEAPITVGHLGQSLDGFIATPSGDSQFVTGEANLVHLHCMRALSDAVVVGAGTVAADDPMLTTRLVEGPNALRVVFDPARRVRRDARLFSDGAAPTLYACCRSLVEVGETHVGHAEILGLADERGRAMHELVDALRARGCGRIFIEGGGVTVSAFLEAGLLDRLQIAIAPLLIGDGRPAIRLAPQASLRDCRRPAYRVFRMGPDVLFDCDLHADDLPPVAGPPVARVI